MSEAPKKRWYVVQAFSGFEGRVATSLREHIKLHNMEELFGEVMVPTEEVVEIRGGQPKKWLKSVAVSVEKANVNSSLATSSFRW